jgi:hypothetical protein
MATTSQITQEVAPVPMLWVLPLTLYLLTYIIAFARPEWYFKLLYRWMFILAVLLVGLMRLSIESWGVTAQVLVYSVGLFACCMCCHGELVHRRPRVEGLTRYYLWIALGGFFGGCFVVLAAPQMFDDYREYSLSLALTGILMIVAGRFETLAPRVERLGLTGAALISLAAFGALAVVMGQLPTLQMADEGKEQLMADRNFYGPLSIYETMHDPAIGHIRVMSHGVTIHGYQYRDPSRRRIATSYYDRPSGIGLAIESHPKRQAGSPIHLGVIGLGTGTIAAYAEERDRCTFYEINPFVIRYCHEYFTFVSDAVARRADIEIREGDARLVLEQDLAANRAGRYDILVVDAFSSDSIPVHLLTRECMEIYWQHLEPSGILAVHLSNRYLDLRPIVARHARDHSAQAFGVSRSVTTEEQQAKIGFESDWVLVTSDTGLAEKLIASGRVEVLHVDDDAAQWTDDFSSLYDVLR